MFDEEDGFEPFEDDAEEFERNQLAQDNEDSDWEEEDEDDV